MNKLTIFFIVATISIVLIIGTLLGIQYFSSDEVESTIQPVEEVEKTATPTSTEPEESEEPEEEEEVDKGPVDYPAIVSPFDFIEEEPEEEKPILAAVTISKVIEAGFKIPDMRSEAFGGIVFTDIDISEYNDDEHIEYTLTESEEFAGIISELIFPDSLISSEVYGSLKLKLIENERFIVNETNQYGESSFFANHTEQKNFVFLVVKIKERLYTLHYPAKNHNKMKNLINLL
ncbi:hypothetical protein ACFLZH_05840 [Patescibacteria group bacterium]